MFIERHEQAKTGTGVPGPLRASLTSDKISYGSSLLVDINGSRAYSLGMPGKGRPRLTPDDVQARIDLYCARYGVRPNVGGLPPFPSGKRETAQHRAWIAVYKAHNRLGRRSRGQCERCSAPAVPGSVFCEAHRAEGSAGHASRVPLEDRRARWTAQKGRCVICGRNVELRESVGHGQDAGRISAVLDARCSELVRMAEALGPQAFERLRRYLWPPRTRSPRKGTLS